MQQDIGEQIIYCFYVSCLSGKFVDLSSLFFF